MKKSKFESIGKYILVFSVIIFVIYWILRAGFAGLVAYSLYWRSVNDPVPDPPYKTCVYKFTEERVIRITASDEYSQSLLGVQYDFFLSTNHGKSWIKIHSFRLDDPWELECQNFDSLNDKFAWTWIGPVYFFVTHDGGKTWSGWNPYDIPELSARECHGRDEIYSIQFKDEYLGTMNIRPMCNISMLNSYDGGITWVTNH